MRPLPIPPRQAHLLPVGVLRNGPWPRDCGVADDQPVHPLLQRHRRNVCRQGSRAGRQTEGQVEGKQHQLLVRHCRWQPPPAGSAQASAQLQVATHPSQPAHPPSPPTLHVCIRQVRSNLHQQRRGSCRPPLHTIPRLLHAANQRLQLLAPLQRPQPCRWVGRQVGRQAGASMRLQGQIVA
jgi:hypothetical protein